MSIFKSKPPILNFHITCFKLPQIQINFHHQISKFQYLISIFDLEFYLNAGSKLNQFATAKLRFQLQTSTPSLKIKLQVQNSNKNCNFKTSISNSNFNLKPQNKTSSSNYSLMFNLKFKLQLNV